MFAYLRYFAIISSILVIIAALGFGAYFRSEASQDLRQMAETSNFSLAQGFINTTWKKHLVNIKRLGAIESTLWGKYKEFRTFSEDTFRHFEGVPVTQLNIYTSEGILVATVSRDAEISYSSDAPTQLLAEDEETQAVFRQALQGRVDSRIIEDTIIKTPAGQEISGTVVQTFIPIMPDSYVSVVAGAQADVEGIIEVFYDITPQWVQLNNFQLWVTVGIIFIFVLLLVTLLLVSKRAESIISTQHEANVELAATAAKAEAESRQKSQFLANVSHELRTPLNAIIGFSEIIKNQVMGPLQNEQYMNYINDIHSSGVHLLSLINDILDFSKAEAGKLELQLSELDATKLIQNCLRLVSPRAEQAKVNLKAEVPKEHFVITGDAKKLKQVMLNLLSNSVKFTPEDGEVRVTAWQNVMDDSISIEVKDSGIGISPKDISRAMSPFGQVDSKLSRKYEGTGLGLPLTKKFVEIMGGTFKIESELNVGTTITITIPLTPPRHVMQAIAKNTPEAPDANREKQISPQLMQSSESTAPSPAQPAAAAAKPSADQKPAAAAEPKPQPVKPAPSALPPTPETTPAQEPKSEALTPPPSPPAAPPTPMQPVRTLTSGSKTEPANPPEPAAVPAEKPRPTVPTQPPAVPSQPPAEPAVQSSPPAEPVTPPQAPPAAPSPAPSAPAEPPKQPPAPQENAPTEPAPPSEPPKPAPTLTAQPNRGTGHTFTSYDDLKKMMQKQGSGGKRSGSGTGAGSKKADMPESSDSSEF